MSRNLIVWTALVAFTSCLFGMSLMWGLLGAPKLPSDTESQWWDKLWADPNATFAAAVAALTLALVLVGIYQGIQLWRTVDATKRAAEHIPKTERAYVFGGPGQRFPPYPLKVPALKVVFTIGNYGKTPAILQRIEWGVCLEDEWPAKKNDRPPYPVEERDVLFAQTGIIAKEKIAFAPNKGPPHNIFYGVIFYKDVFGDSHESLWRHRIEWNPSRNDWDTPALEGNGTERK